MTPRSAQVPAHHAVQHVLAVTLLLAGCASESDAPPEPVNGAGASAQAPNGVAAQAGGSSQPGSSQAGSGVQNASAAGSGAVRSAVAGQSGAVTVGAGVGAAAVGGGAQPMAGVSGVGGQGGSGAAGSAPTNASPDACRPKFGSGLNVAWFKFAGDVPNPDLTRFTQLYKDTYAAGGRIVRWWFHTNGTVTPGYDAKGLAKPLAANVVSDVGKILDAAHSAGVAVVVSLWSFDMLQGNQSAPLDNNYALLTQDANRQAYIDNVLTPLVTAHKGHPGLYAWEIFNEAEGMTTQHGWTMQSGGRTIDERLVQVCVNWFADAIHKADPGALVTTGAWQFAVNANVNGYKNLYSDSALRSVGGRDGGILDFYQVHYYANWNGSEVVSPFTHPASYWNVDKALQIGEFWAIATNGIAADSLYAQLFDTGYRGAWAWQYANEDSGNNGAGSTKWPAMQVPMQKLQQAHGAELECASGR